MSIPQKVRASVVVAQSQQFVGAIPVRQLSRLCEALASEAGALEVSLTASNVAGHAMLKGHVHGDLQLRCSRCEQAYPWTLQQSVDVRLVSSEAEEQQALADSDPVMVVDDQLQLHEWIEDEALLGLPMLPRCESCENSVRNAPKAPNPQGERENPFAALKKLKF